MFPTTTTSTTAGSTRVTVPPRRLTGFKPTGQLQLGNLIGAIQPMIAAQTDRAAAGRSVVAIVDLHALTVEHRPHEVRAVTFEQAGTLLAAGVDPERTTLYVQSQL